MRKLHQAITTEWIGTKLEIDIVLDLENPGKMRGNPRAEAKRNINDFSSVTILNIIQIQRCPVLVCFGFAMASIEERHSIFSTLKYEVRMRLSLFGYKFRRFYFQSYLIEQIDNIILFKPCSSTSIAKQYVL